MADRAARRRDPRGRAEPGPARDREPGPPVRETPDAGVRVGGRGAPAAHVRRRAGPQIVPPTGVVVRPAHRTAAAAVQVAVPPVAMERPDAVMASAPIEPVEARAPVEAGGPARAPGVTTDAEGPAGAPDQPAAGSAGIVRRVPVDALRQVNADREQQTATPGHRRRPNRRQNQGSCHLASGACRHSLITRPRN